MVDCVGVFILLFLCEGMYFLSSLSGYIIDSRLVTLLKITTGLGKVNVSRSKAGRNFTEKNPVSFVGFQKIVYAYYKERLPRTSYVQYYPVVYSPTSSATSCCSDSHCPNKVLRTMKFFWRGLYFPLEVILSVSPKKVKRE